MVCPLMLHALLNEPCAALEASIEWLTGAAGFKTPRRLSPYSEILKNAPISPMIPRRNASTQIMKITPCVTVTQAPNCAR